MSDESEVSRHYASGGLMARLRRALGEDGVDPGRPTLAALAPYDQFHGCGMEATRELAAGLPVSAGGRILDVGSGIGGPARFFAETFGCRVTGIDLTAEFCEVARNLTQVLGLDGRVAFAHGNALAMPFADAGFDGAYSMNVFMNVADKAGLYREIRTSGSEAGGAETNRPSLPLSCDFNGLDLRLLRYAHISTWDRVAGRA